MEYVGLYKKAFYSTDFEEEVSILKYKDSSNMHISYCDCSICGKPIKTTMYVVQSKTNAVELAYVGASCIKKIK